MVTYKTHIQSREWREKRSAVILLARGKCERCGKWPVVNVHHLTYDNLGSEPLTDLMGVCRKCHKEIHSLWN